MGRLEPDAYLCFDLGLEMRNSIVRDYLKEIGLELITSTTGKCVIVERAIGNVKRLIMQYVTETEGRRYIHKIPEFESVLNHRYHRSLGMSPMEAEKDENRTRVLDISQRRYNKIQSKVHKEKPKFKVGDKVRLANNISHYKRAGDENFSIEVFKIKEVLNDLPVTLYTLEEYGGDEPVPGRYYSSQLQKMLSLSFKIDHVVSHEVDKQTGRERFKVRWLDLPERFDSWVPKEKLTKDQYDKYNNRKKTKRK